MIDVDAPNTWADGIACDADIHVCHTRFPDVQRYRIKNRTGSFPKIVFVSHGIPEHIVELAANDLLVSNRYEATDFWMLLRHWLRVADAFVVFSPRQQALFQTMVHSNTIIDCVPLGVDREFWAGAAQSDRLRGQPAVWMSENQHRIKWALDMILAWPFVTHGVPQAHLHAHYIPLDLHRILVDLANTNGAAYSATISSKTYTHEQLRNIWKGVDFNLATTRYGDNTCLTMEAEAAGLKTISYPGNAYASYWIPEGDQRDMADALIQIFDGRTPMREKLPVPDLADMGRAMLAIYHRVLGTTPSSTSEQEMSA